MSLSRKDKILVAPGFNPGMKRKIFRKNPVGVQYLSNEELIKQNNEELNMQSKELKVQECDATEDERSNEAGNKKFNTELKKSYNK